MKYLIPIIVIILIAVLAINGKKELEMADIKLNAKKRFEKLFHVNQMCNQFEILYK